MLMFIIYAFILFISSTLFGKLFIKKESKLYSLSSIIGFLIMLGILELGYFPVQYLYLSSNYSNIWSLIVIGISFIFGIIKLKREDFYFLKNYEFYFIVICMFIVFKIIPGVDSGDEVFYIPYIIDNSKGLVNVIDPYVGLDGTIDIYHYFRGIYFIPSLLYRIQSLITNSVSNGFIVYRSTFSLLFSIYSSMIYSYVRNNLKTNKWFILLLEICSFVLIGTKEWACSYYGTFSLLTMFMPLYMILINCYLENKKDRMFKLLIILVTIGLNALGSTQIYLCTMIITSYICYELVTNKKINIEDYILFLLPILVMASIFRMSIKLLIISVLGFIICYVFRKYINNLLNKIGKYLIIIVPIGFTVLNYMYGYGFNWKYSSGYGILVFNLLMTGVLIYLLIKKVKLPSYLYVFIFVVLIYFNPLVGGFICKFITSKESYYRLFYITKNPLVIMILFYTLYNYFKKTKIFKYGLLICILGLTGLYGIKMLKLTFLNDHYFVNYNYLARDSYYNIGLGNYLKTLDDGSRVLTMSYSARSYNPKLVQNIYRYAEDTNYKDNELVDDLEEILYLVCTGKEKVNDEFLELIKDYDYIITFDKNTDLNNYYDYSFNNEHYIVYKVK